MTAGTGRHRRNLQEKSAEIRAAGYTPGRSKYRDKKGRRKDLELRLQDVPAPLLEQR